MYHDDAARQPYKNPQYSWLWLFLVITGIAICVPLFIYGSEVAHSLRFADYLWLAPLGGILTGLLMGATARLGAVTGLTSSMIVQRLFGARGGVIAFLGLMLASLGWWGIQTEFMAKVLQAMLWEMYQVKVALPWLAIVGGACMATTSILGARAIGALSYVAVPLLLLALLLPWAQFSGADLAKIMAFVPTTAQPWGLVLAGIIGGWMGGVVVMPDLGRLVRSPQQAFWGALLSCAVAYPLLLLLSGSMSLVLGEVNFIVLYPLLGFGVLGVLTVVFATWTSNDNNLYSATLPLVVWTGWSRVKLTVAAAVVGIAVAAWGAFSHLLTLMVWFGVVLGPLAALMLVAHWQRPHWFDLAMPLPRWRASLLGVWGLGVVAGVLTTPKEGFGLGVLTLTTAPTLDAFLVTVVLALLVLRWGASHARAI